MLYNQDVGITYEDVKRENVNELGQFQDLIEFNSQIQRRSGNDQFSKGFRRLKMWLDLAYKKPSVFVGKNGEAYAVKSLNVPDSEAKTYALAGLMVIFQVFGDGNHRTAAQYFQSITGRNLTEQEMEFINSVHNSKGNDFSQIFNNPYPPAKIDEIVDILMSKYPSLSSSSRSMRDNGAGAGANRYGGKKTKRKTKGRKLKNKRKKTYKKNKSYKRRKTKTCWDSNIISPVFFGYSLKK